MFHRTAFLKRSISFVLCLVFLTGLFSACKPEEGPPAGGTESSSAVETSSETSGETSAETSADVTPEASTTAPEPPEVSEPETTVTDPETTVKEPETTVKEPETTVKDPETTVKEPETTVKEPETTVKEPETTVKEPETTVKEPETTVKPPETTKAPETTAKDPEPVEPSAVPPASGTLLYREDFEGHGTPSTNDAVMSALGWTILNKADGAYTDSTAKYAIVSKGGNAVLQVTNYGSGLGSDSYVEILPGQTFRYLNGQNFTYQYDITYADASNTDRYIALVSSYKEGFYQSAHLRNSGKLHTQCHDGSAWKNYAPSRETLAKFGVSGSLKGVTVTVRYVVDWENGCRVYGKKAGDSAWVLLSTFDPNETGAALFDPSVGGAGLVLKVGGAQNGTVDNIYVWSGTMETPNDKNAVPYLTGEESCHRMVIGGGKYFCVLCGRTEAEIESAWLLDEAPVYDGGIPSQGLYLTGQGLDPAQPLSKEGRMQIVAQTNETQFAAYLTKLASAGYRKESDRTADGNRYASYVKGTQRIYTYYTAAYKEVRVISESTEVSASVKDFGYSYAKKAGEVTAIYQYALPLRDIAHTKSQNYVDRGMLYVVKLADNKLVLFDGGESVQFTDARLDELMAFLREITGVGTNGRVTIAAWYLTHAHQDHVQGFCMLAKRYAKSLTLERVFYNIPSSHSDNETVQNVNNSITGRMLKYIEKYFGSNVEFLKIHTGQEIRLGDAVFEILYTHEDLVDPDTAETEIGTNYNEGSSVVKITFDGKSVLITGDIDTKAATVLLRSWKAETLQVDVLQVAHHVLNVLTDLYHTVRAPILFVPQSEDRINEHSTAPKTFAAAKAYAESDMIFFQNEGTFGLAVQNGEFTLVYEGDIRYESRAYTWPAP